MTNYIDLSKYENTYLDVPYGNDSNSQKLDIILPETGEGPFPVIVFIHGGAFKMGDKSYGELIPPMIYGLNKGYAAVGLNYRLSGEIVFPEPVRDIKRAIRFIKAQSKNYNLDAERIILWGGSAGGYMVLMGSLIEDVEYFDTPGDPSSHLSARVQGTVAWYPPAEFIKMDGHLKESGLLEIYPDHDAEDSPESLFLGVPILKAGELLEKSNPASYIHQNIPPMLIQHGRIDRVVPYQQSLDFSIKAKERAGEERIVHEIIDEADHADDKFLEEKNIQRIYTFIDEVINKL